MLYEKIMRVSKALSILDGQVNEDQWNLILMAKNELMDAADQAQEMERSAVPEGCQKGGKPCRKKDIMRKTC
jgi:hypothetical protein